MRVAQLVFGAILAALIAALVASVVYAGVVYALAKDPSVFKALEAGRYLAAWQDWRAHVGDPKHNTAALVAAATAFAAVVGLVVVTVFRDSKGAHFQTAGELMRGGFFKANTMFVGRLGGLSLAWKTWGTDPTTKIREAQTSRKLVGGRYVHMPDFGHALISGPTRSGKGAALIIPNALEFPGSMIILDIRGETFERTAGYRATFSKIIKLAPSNERSHCYNPLDFVRRTPGLFEADIMSIAGGIVNQSAGDKYWSKDAIELVAGVIGYVLEADNVSDKNLGAVMDVILGRDEAQATLREIVDRHKSQLSTFTLSKIVPFATMSEKQWNGVFGMLRTSLSPFNNPITRKVLSRSSFDLFKVRKEPHTIYVDFRLSQLNAMSGLCNVLVTQIMNYLTDDLRAKGEHQVMFMLDEFTTLGEIGPLMGLLKVGAGNGIAIWAFVQSMTNVRDVYGEGGVDNFLDNIEAFVFLGGSSESVLGHVERRLGKKIVKQKVRRTQPGATVFDGRRSEEVREVEKSLMSVDELSQLDRRVAIVLPRGAGPVRIWRNYWFADKSFVKRAAVPLSATAIPDLSRGLPPSFKAPRTGGEPNARPKAGTPAATILARLDPNYGAADQRVRPGARFLGNSSIQARRAASGLLVVPAARETAGKLSPAGQAASGVERERETIKRDGAAPAASTSAAPLTADSVEQAPAKPLEQAPPTLAPVEGAEPRGEAAISVCLVPLRDVWVRKETVRKIEDLCEGDRLGDLLACPAARSNFEVGVSPPLRRTIKAKLARLGLEGCKVGRWPLVESPSVIDRHTAVGKALVATILSEPKSAEPDARAAFEEQREAALREVTQVHVALASNEGEDFESLKIADILARRNMTAEDEDDEAA
jgi:type IV secretory pathway TraG/TraD family ATPase VirD4